MNANQLCPISSRTDDVAEVDGKVLGLYILHPNMVRYAISLIPIKTSFPVLTLLTNLIGAVIIGFIVSIVSGKEEYSDVGVKRT